MERIGFEAGVKELTEQFILRVVMMTKISLQLNEQVSERDKVAEVKRAGE